MTDLERRRERVAAAWNLDDAVVLIRAGEPIPVPGTDQFFPFRAHPEHRYLAGSATPGAVLAFDPNEGWTLFAPPVTEADVLWEGATPPAGPTTEALGGWLDARAAKSIAVLGQGSGANADGLPGRSSEGAKAGDAFDTDLAAELRAKLDALRRIKDAGEIGCLRRAAAATAAGFQAARDAIRPGATERAVQARLEAAFVEAGGDGPGFDTIVAAGAHAATLHFTPSRAAIGEGDLVLVDAGAAVDGYSADVTRTFGAGARGGFRRDLFDVVLAAQEAAVGRCAPGREFHELHLACCADLARGLVDLGLLKGRPEDLVERDAHALFFPHGLGHLIGLCVHDAGGYLEGRERSDRFGLAALRADLPLEPGMTLTIEPGLYLVPAILNDPARRARYRDDVAWDRVDGLLGIGGVRIEDDVLVTEGGAEVLTASIPKTVDA